jgi:hypothetical protein
VEIPGNADGSAGDSSEIVWGCSTGLKISATLGICNEAAGATGAGGAQVICSIGCGDASGGCSKTLTGRLTGGGGGGKLIEGETRETSDSSCGICTGGCSALVTSRERTSSVAESEAADVCARTIGGNALPARLLAQAELKSLTAWCNSFTER